MDAAGLAAFLGLPGLAVTTEVRDEPAGREITLTDEQLTLRCPWRRPATDWNGATIILPWYDVPSMFADAAPAPLPDPPRDKFPVADELLDLGFGVVVIPWWAEAMAWDCEHRDLARRYGPPATDILARGWRSGMARSLRDVLAVVDAVAPDAGTLATWGHSLGGKLALFAAAVEPRLRACVTHELGLGWEHSNWFEPWYLGGLTPDFDCDTVLRLVAPRPVLYGAGHGFDAEPSIELARTATVGDWQPGILEHHAGHRPTAETRQQTYRWLTDQLVS